MDSERRYSPDIPSENIESSDLSGKQIAAIKHAVLRGREIQDRFPQIADDYRQGMPLSQIVEKYNIHGEFNLRKQIARTAVHTALFGFNGEMKVNNQPAYPGLITDEEEISTLREKHIRENGKRMGSQMKLQGGGMFALSKEQQREVGKKSGEANFQAKVGIHAQTPEQRAAASKLGHEARGIEILSDEENALIEELLANPEYKKGKYTDVAKITRRLNERFHNDTSFRRPENIKAILYNRRKKLQPKNKE